MPDSLSPWKELTERLTTQASEMQDSYYQIQECKHQGFLHCFLSLLPSECPCYPLRLVQVLYLLSPVTRKRIKILGKRFIGQLSKVVALEPVNNSHGDSVR